MSTGRAAPRRTWIAVVGLVLAGVGVLGLVLAAWGLSQALIGAEQARFVAHNVAAARALEDHGGDAALGLALSAASLALGLGLVVRRSAVFRWTGWILATLLVAGGAVGIVAGAGGQVGYGLRACAQSPPPCRSEGDDRDRPLSPTRGRWRTELRALLTATGGAAALAAGGALGVGWLGAVVGALATRRQRGRPA